MLVCELRGSLSDEEKARLADLVRTRVLAELDVALADLCFAGGLVERTTSGKVARSATRARYLAAGYRPQPPASSLTSVLLSAPPALEQSLLTMVARVLGVARLGPQDNLFEAGADSLMMLRLLLHVEEHFGVKTPTEFFRQPTVARLACLLAGEDPEGSRSGAIPAAPQPAATPGLPTVKLPITVHVARRWRKQLRGLLPRVRVRILIRARFETHAFRLHYFEGLRWLIDWCGRPWVQALLYPVESQLVRRFALSMGTPAGQIPREIMLNLVQKALVVCRVATMQHTNWLDRQTCQA